MWGSIAGVVGAALALPSAYLLVLATASLRAHRDGEPIPGGRSRLAVLVPAHNEQAYLPRCLDSLFAQDYDPRLFEVVVVADNCSDQTSQLAAVAGATVLERFEPDQPGKGRALRWAMDQIMGRPEPPDAFVVVDADSIAASGLLSGLTRAFETGAEAVQGEYLVLRDAGSPGSELRAVAFLLFHKVRFTGRASLGLPCSLVGNGMLFSRQLLERLPWEAFTGAEDLEYSTTLRLAGVRPVFAPAALVSGPVPDGGRAALTQRSRWEGGRLHVAAKLLPDLVRQLLTRRRFDLWDAVVDLATPPLGLLAVADLAGTVGTSVLALARLAPLWTAIPWATASAALVGYVFLGLLAADAPVWMYRRLISSPRFLVDKVLHTAEVVRSSRKANQWIRTERPGEVA